jgi:uncharacterized protein YijF (DUF1287 family)
MLTAGDIKFEPQQTKIMNLTSSIALMLAGDAAMQAEILFGVREDVNRRIQGDPQNWWLVRDVAELYAKYSKEASMKRAETAILSPLGLDRHTFFTKQQEMVPDLANKIAVELINFDPPLVETIITGIDAIGAHIYIVRGSKVSCEDPVGFAAIGAGSWHADSQFMFAGHTRQRAFPESLLLVYSAKKRAEVAPGVGEATDMFLIGPALGSFTPVGSHVLENLEKIYRETRRKEQAIAKKAEERAVEYVNQIIAAAATATKEQPALPENPGGNEATDQTDSAREPAKTENS